MKNAKEIISKLVNRKLLKEDLGRFFESLKWYISQSEYAEDEIYGWDKQVQFILDDSEDFTISVEEPLSDHPILSIKYGRVKSPHTTISTNSNILTGILCRRIRFSELTSETFKLEGDYSNYTLIFTLMNMMLYELK